jgi:hypothetical protein
MKKTQTGTAPDGTATFNFELTQEEHDAGYVAFVTGPIINGTISLPSGAAYDVTENIIPVKREHVGELHIAIHKLHHAAGRMLDVPVPALSEVELKDEPETAPAN